MVQGFKIKKNWLLALCMAFCWTSPVFSQEISDAEIGLNVPELILALKEKGMGDEDIEREIIFLREDYKKRHLEMKSMQEEPSSIHMEGKWELGSGAVFSDQEIGLNVEREILFLKESGVANADDIALEIDRVREKFTAHYILMKKIEEEVFGKSGQRQLLRSAGMAMDVSQSEKEALKALYDSTNGFNWADKRGWDFSTPVTSWNYSTKTGWYGIAVEDGKIVDLSFAGNNLNGSIPPEIGQLKYLKRLNFSWDSKLTGSIPEEIGQLENLEILGLPYNNLNGALPKSLYNLKALRSLSLNRNQLKGELLPDIGKLANLSSMSLNDNQFTGEIPSAIGQLPKLSFINLSFNQFTGGIPPELGLLSGLNTLYLGNNKLINGIPYEISQLKYLYTLGLENNKLSGTIPALFDKIPFNSVYLNGNSFEGVVPNMSISNLLDIRYNKFRFADFSNQFIAYKTKLNTRFTFSPQLSTDASKTVSSSAGRPVAFAMFEDGKHSAAYSYQWFKNGVAINGAVNRVYEIFDLKFSHGATYTCKSYHNANPDMSPLVLEREPVILKVISCEPIVGTITAVK